MVFNPARPEIATVTSEALQLKVRQLLPSQDGFGADLAAQNVIVPIIDLTEAAEGSDVPEQLQTALAFGSQTAFAVTNTTTTIANTAGFYRIVGTCNLYGTAGRFCRIQLTDGVTTKVIWAVTTDSGGTSDITEPFDFIIFLASGESCSLSASSSEEMNGSIRQIATSSGTLVQPSGFTPE